MERAESAGQTPSHAKKVFSGVLFDVYQWEQELYDGSTTTFERLKRRDGAFVIPVLSNGNLLIAEDEQPGRGTKLTFPGGQVEDGETPEEGARRELLEETGYAVRDLVLLSSVRPVSKMDWDVHCYIGKGATKVQEPQNDPGERITLKEITLDELIGLVDHPQFQHTMLALLLVKAKYDPEARKFLEEKLFG